jgi:hypothetical protein
MKHEFTAKDYELIEKLAAQSGLVYDGHEDDRIFAQDLISYNVALMSKEQYKKLTDDLSSYSKKGKGFEVGGWNDASSYEYWKKQGEADDCNYIQVTAYVSNPEIVNPEELKAAVDEVSYYFSKCDNLNSKSSENTSLSAIVNKIKLVTNPQDVFTAPNFSEFSSEDIEAEGFHLVETLFCDQSGLGAPHERALTKNQVVETVKDLLSEHGKLYAAITGEGQFQIYVSLFKKLKK